MVDHTHYYRIIGDAHVRGRVAVGGPTHVDPILGQIVNTAAPVSPLPVVGNVVRGATSGSAGIIRSVLSSSSFLLEAIGNAILPLPPGGAFAQQNTGPLTGETLNFDNGATGVVSPVGDAQLLPLFNQHLAKTGDTLLNATLPADPTTQPGWPKWHREAKVARVIDVTTATLVGTVPYYRPGDRVSNGAGATATVLRFLGSNPVSQVYIINASGTFSTGQTLSNTTLGGGTQGSIAAVGANPNQGTWLAYAALPNIRGLGSNLGFEFIANHTPGPDNRLLHAAWTYHAASPSPNDRGVKLYSYATVDAEPSGDAILGGVVVQVVKCTGTFPTSWVAGETVTGGGSWSGKVLGFNATQKYLYVVDVNGNTLTASTVTGGTSGASATSLGAAHGWQKGSTHWTAMVADNTNALAAQNALENAAARQEEGLVLMHHETELTQHSVLLTCPFPSSTQANAAWAKHIADLRELFGNPNLPIVLWCHRLDSQLTNVPFGSFITREAKKVAAAAIPRVRYVTSDDAQMEVGGFLQLRWQDYIDLGDKFWRHLRFGQVEVPNGNYRLLPVGIYWGQSNMTGSIPAAAMMSIDRDPELWPSPNFGGANTTDGNLLTWNHRTKQIEPFACDLNSNTSWSTLDFTCGPDVPIAVRMKRRYSEHPVQSAPFCTFKYTVPGSSCSQAVMDPAGCWDPLLTTRPQQTATCVVTILPPSGSIPARARFTATAGTFTGAWAPQVAVGIAGSAAPQGGGGNNSAPYTVQLVYAVAGDGEWIEVINGAFAAEASRPFTFTIGPPPIWPDFEASWRAFQAEAGRKGWIPWVTHIVSEQGESDLPDVANYETVFGRVWQAIEALTAPRTKGSQKVAKCIVISTNQTPWGTDEQVAGLRAAQKAVAESLENCVTVDNADMPMAINPQGTVVRENRQDNDVHRTARGHVIMGFRIDAALATLGAEKGIPPHPKGELAVDFGAVDGGVPGVGTDDDNDEVEDGGDGGDGESGEEDTGTDGPGVPGTGGLIVEDGTGIDDAECFCTIDRFDAYWAKNGSPAAVTGATTSQKAAAIRRANREWTEGVCGGLWRGQIQFMNQRLSFPRMGCYDDDGRMLTPGTIPWQILDAEALVAGDLLAGGTILANGVDRAPVVRETKRGLGFEKTIEYSESAATGTDSVRRLRAAEALVYPFVRGGAWGVARS